MFSNLTDQQLSDVYDDYYAALRAISTGQNYSIEGVSVSRADLSEVKDTLAEIDREKTNRSTRARGGRVGVMTPKW